jgi:lipoprotein-anchoring transpeptidase ErfK/SrfK
MPRFSCRLYGSAALVLLLAACSPAASADQQVAASTSTPPAQSAASPPPAPAAQPPVPSPAPAVAVAATTAGAAPDDPRAQAINQATLAAARPAGPDPALVRAEVLLARAHFSPGVIDGRDGGNLRHAVSAYQQAHGLPVDGQIDQAVWNALTTGDSGRALVSYVITDADVAGPFLTSLPSDFRELAKLPALGYTSPLEEFAERFHMDKALLKALNPGADFAKSGASLVVANVGPADLDAPVTAIEVDKSAGQVRAFGANGALLAVYPATVGSTERPAPSGQFSVKGVAKHPDYTYDPKRLRPQQSGRRRLDRAEHPHLWHPWGSRPPPGRQGRQPWLRPADELGRSAARRGGEAGDEGVLPGDRKGLRPRRRCVRR